MGRGLLAGLVGALAVRVAADLTPQVAHSHTFFHPWSQDPAHEFWALSGGAKDTDEGVTLLSSGTLTSSGVWSKVPLQSSNFSVEVSLNFVGVDPARASEGFALWYLDEPDFESVQAVVNGSSENQLWGVSPSFKGFGALFSASNRVGDVNPSVSAAISDGSRPMDPKKEVPTSAGVYYNWRLKKGTLRIKINFSSTEGILGKVKAENKDWITCFNIPTAQVTPGGFLGMSGSLASIANITDAATASGDSLSLTSWTTTNYDEAVVSLVEDAKFVLSDRELIKNITSEEPPKEEGPIAFGESGVAALSSGDSNNHQAMFHVMARFIEQSSFNHVQFMKKFNKIEMANEALSKHIQGVDKGLRDLASSEFMKAELKGLKDVVSSAHNQQAEVIRQLGSSISENDLAGRSDSLEKSVRRHAMVSAGLSVTFGVVVSGLGFITFKRMKDMEKKHIL